MGVAGGAHEGDMDRAKLSLMAQQNALRGAEIEQRDAMERARLAETQRQFDVRQQQADWNAQAERIQRDDQFRQMLARMPRKSPYSVWSNAGGGSGGAEDDGTALQQSMLKQYREVRDQGQAQQRQRKAAGQANMASLMKLALENGGQAPIEAIQFANRQLGFDNETQAIGGAGFTQNGDWFVDFVQKDPRTGRISRKTNVMPRQDQGKVFYGQHGVFDNNDRALWRRGMRKAGFSEKEVNTYAGVDADELELMSQTANDRFATMGDKLKALAAVQKFVGEYRDMEGVTPEALAPYMAKIKAMVDDITATYGAGSAVQEQGGAAVQEQGGKANPGAGAKAEEARPQTFEDLFRRQTSGKGNMGQRRQVFDEMEKIEKRIDALKTGEGETRNLQEIRYLQQQLDQRRRIVNGEGMPAEDYNDGEHDGEANDWSVVGGTKYRKGDTITTSGGLTYRLVNPYAASKKEAWELVKDKDVSGERPVEVEIVPDEEDGPAPDGE